MSDETTRDLVHRWLTWDKDPSTRVQIEALAAGQQWSQLEKYLRTHIKFGTAGLRGPMLPGFANINCLTVIQASQGIASYLASSSSQPKSLLVVIGFDTRHQSAKFARLAANAFKSKGIETILFERYVPTPLVSFGVLHFHADAGVMITASHNPAQDNGYKVYWSNGAQINVPLDQYIAASILENQEPWEDAWDTTPNQKSLDVVDDLLNAYVGQIEKALGTLQPSYADTQTAVALSGTVKTSVMYTPLHGVGTYYFNWVTNRVTCTIRSACRSQMLPDPDFPTLKFPNPEEEGALNQAFLSANAAEQSLVIANDPDADRFAAAQKMPDGKWHRFTGDQMGVLLASYLLDRVDHDQVAASWSKDKVRKIESYSTDVASASHDVGGADSSEISADPSAYKPRKVAVLTTAVSSGMLSRMAHVHGVYFEETLTGFKWLANHAHAMAPEYSVIFAYEEALGYMFPSISYDKDGIAAASIFLNAVGYWKSRDHIPGPMNPYQKLQSLYRIYGYHESINTYFISGDPDYTRDFFNAIRMSSELEKLGKLGTFKVVRWRDVTNGTEHPTPPDPNAFVTKLPVDPSSQMLTFNLQKIQEAGERENSVGDLVTATIRASGTEPKVKLYLECRSMSERKAQWLVGIAFETLIWAWWVEYGEKMQPASPRVRSSSGMMHDTYTYVS